MIVRDYNSYFLIHNRYMLKRKYSINTTKVNDLPTHNLR